MFQPQKHRLSEDLRGIGNLTIDAVVGMTDIVESLHHTISSFAGILAHPGQHRTTGITGMVYRNIRTITGLLGAGIDGLMEGIGPMFDEKAASPGREAAVSALNGVLGDHLEAKNNPLAIPMQLRRNGEAIDDQALSKTARKPGDRIAVLVHGLCMSDLQWDRFGHDHGAALARDLGLLPLYVHYNTGRHISDNGKELADRLETLIGGSPQRPEIFIIGHSMGGLVSRSACHYGKNAGHSWLDRLRKLVFLGTPHHGAFLEKGGNWINTVLDINPYSAPFSRMGKIRSSGITDLRFGNVVEADWKGRKRFGYSKDQRVPVPLPEGVQCYSIAARSSQEPGRINDEVIGDGLVPLSSALGRHKKAGLDLSIPEDRQWVGSSVNHMDLLNHPKVYETIRTWLAE